MERETLMKKLGGWTDTHLQSEDFRVYSYKTCTSQLRRPAGCPAPRGVSLRSSTATVLGQALTTTESSWRPRPQGLMLIVLEAKFTDLCYLPVFLTFCSLRHRGSLGVSSETLSVWLFLNGQTSKPRAFPASLLAPLICSARSNRPVLSCTAPWAPVRNSFFSLTHALPVHPSRSSPSHLYEAFHDIFRFSES